MSKNFQKMEVEEAHAEAMFRGIDDNTQNDIFYGSIAAEGMFSSTLQGPIDTMLVLSANTLFISNPNALRVEPWGSLAFTFDLKFEVLYQCQQNVLSSKTGFRLFYDNNNTMSFYTDRITLERWILLFEGTLNQKGFHEMFKPVRRIGKGNFATVYEVERKTDSKKFAVKAFSRQAAFATPCGKESLINELTILRYLSRDNQQNVLKLHGVYESQKSVYLIFQLLEGGQLNSCFQAKEKKFSRKETTQIIQGLLSGLKHIHSLRIMHRDLKPQNIMLRGTTSMEPVIVDFGLASLVDLDRYLFFRCGTPGYVAPQIMFMKECKHIEPECDIFSLGVIFHLLLTGKSLFGGSKYEDVYKNNKQLQLDFSSPAYSCVDSQALDLMTKMLTIDPAQRITAAEALTHPFLSEQVQRVMEKHPDFSPAFTNVSDDVEESTAKRHLQTRIITPLPLWQC